MCNDWFNIRFGVYYLQIGPDSGISGGLISIRRIGERISHTPGSGLLSILSLGGIYDPN